MVTEEKPKVLKELFYSDPQMEILETTSDRVLFLAGVGSGKSQVIGVLSYEFIINNPEVRGFIGANTYNQLAKSTLDRVFNVWEKSFGLIKNVHYVVDNIPPSHFKKFGSDLKSYENTISFENGALIFLASLDNYKVIDGTEFGWACLDETKDTKEEAVKEVIVARLRQKGMCINPKTGVISKTMKPGYIGYNPLYIFTSPAKTKWLIEWFDLVTEAEEISKHIFSKTDYYRRKKGRQFVVISSSWHNANNLPAGYIEGLVKDYSHNEGLVDMLIYGSPFGKTGGEFITTFSRLKHVKTFDIWPEEVVHLSFDFNVVPYMTCTCWQVKFNPETNRYLVRAFDEFCLPNPKNNCEALAKEIEAKYSKYMRKGIYYYGDYSGKNGSVLLSEFKNNYQVIEKFLRLYITNSSDRVVTNKGLSKRKLFMNNAFAGALPLDVEIHPQCKELINDLEFLKEGPDGGKLKLKVKVNDITFEERGHCFIGSTLIETSKGKVRIDKINPGDYVLTRKGYKKVLRKFDNGIKKVNKYLIGNKELICTPDHKIFTYNKGFIRVNELIDKNIFCIFEENKIWKKKLSILTESTLQDTLNQNIIASETIIQDGLNGIQLDQKRDCTNMFGCLKTVIYQKVITFIIKMKTRLITIYQTSNVKKEKNIYLNMEKKFQMKQNKKDLIILERQENFLKNGTDQKLVLNGTENTLNKHFQQSQQKEFAEIVNPILYKHTQVTQNTVHTNARLNSLMIENSEELGNQNVYDLMIEDEHEYFANGILVHNCCDSMEYFFTSAFETLFNM